MEISLQLRVAAIFIMLSASLLGVALPLYCSGASMKTIASEHEQLANSETFRIARCFAAGIMIGIAFIHLLADGSIELSEVSLDYPALGFTLATVGVLIVLGLEQVTVMLIARVKLKAGNNKVVINEKDSETNQDGTHSHSQELEVVESVAHASHGCHDHSHAIQMIAGANSLNVIVKAYMMEISVAIHSIIIGIALGANNDPAELIALRALIAAITFHQFFEGVGLGTVIEQARLDLGLAKIIGFALTFALTTPVGIMIGIAITETNEELTSAQETTQTYVLGSLNCLAAGILIYVALVEMLAEDFQSAAIASNYPLKAKMFISLTTGVLILAIIAMWA